jgi:hypothetical protein
MYTNQLLRELIAAANEKDIRVTQNMTSHSTRSGATNALHMKRECNKLEIERRGGWNTDRTTSYNRYYRTTSYSDGIM